MAVEITKTVSLESEQGFFTLDQLREFVVKTEDMSAKTKVHVTAPREYVRMRATYGDIAHH